MRIIRENATILIFTIRICFEGFQAKKLKNDETNESIEIALEKNSMIKFCKNW